MSYHIEVYPPGHPNGVKHHSGTYGLWLWEVHSANDIEMSGTSDERQDAIDQATTALDELMGVDE